jgi:hypothetical protein
VRTLSGHLGWVNAVAFVPDGHWLVSGSSDGTVRVWDPGSGKQRVSLVDFKDGSSVAVTPEGFFDSSSAQAEEYLNVRVGSCVFGIASYRDKFYRPDLVKRGLAGEPLTRFGDIGNEKLAPLVDLVEVPASTSESKLTVKLRITDSGGGIGRVRLYLNGTAVVQDETTTAPAGAPLALSYTVSLPWRELRVCGVRSAMMSMSSILLASRVSPAPASTPSANSTPTVGPWSMTWPP